VPDQSTSSRTGVRQLGVLLWTLVSLVVLDIAVGAMSRMPADPRVQPSTLQRYSDYGRSIAGKLRAMIKPDDDRSAPIVVAGWIDSSCRRTVPTIAGALEISIFGNSFSGQLSDSLRKLNPAVSIEEYLGPGAPPNHSYACFVRENSFGGDSHDVQIIGVTSSSLPRMETIWGVTTSFEYPQPFTFPRYRLGPGGSLIAHEPSVRSPDDLRRILSDRAKWDDWLAELKANDYFYVHALTTEDPADRSVIARMIRRGFGQYVSRRRTAKLRADDGKFNAPDIVNVLPKLISSFAKLARESGKRPIVVLFEEYGYGGVLMPLLRDTLAHDRIEYVYSGNIVPANDLRNYASDGHFSAAANAKLATALLKLIDDQQANVSPDSGNRESPQQIGWIDRKAKAGRPGRRNAGSFPLP
jgi:hypothetical protein